MSPSFAPDFKELVRSRTNLVELVGESIALKAKGPNDHVGLCPFHQDHNPSFHVYADRQTYRCWVCQEGGDCFSFVMKYEGVSFPQALESLARRAGLEMPKRERNLFARGNTNDGTGDGANGREINKNELYEICAWAEQQYHECLNSRAGDEARSYLLERGFTAETIAKYRLGYHPNDWEWLLGRARGRYTPQQLHLARVIGEREGRGYFDNFVDRVVFPIRDERGRPVAFGGRVLPGRDSANGKYWNSPEGPLFSKSRIIYGLDVARDEIRKTETAVIVEGYADCIMVHQHGVLNAVAAMGTALPESQVQLLKRFARRVVLVFDGDDAGRMNAEKALGKFLASEIDLRVLTLPEGSKDPDEYLRQHGADSFRALMAQAPDVLTYKLACAIDKYGLDTNPTTGARDLVLREMLDLMAESRDLAGTSREDAMRSRLAQRLLIPEETIFRQLQQRRQRNGQRTGQQFGQQGGRSSQQSGQHFGHPPGGPQYAERRPARPVQRPGQDVVGRPVAVGRVIAGPSSLPPGAPGTTTEKPPGRVDSPAYINLLRGVLSKDELQERDILEILFTAPEWADDIRSHVSVSDFQNEHLRDLAQVCFDVAEQGKPPSCDQVLAALEDPELKRLAVAIDGMAREKGLRELLHHRPNPAERLLVPEQPVPGQPAPSGQASSGGTGEFAFVDGAHDGALEGAGSARPLFLQQAIDRMMWRRQEQTHQQSRLRIAQLENSSGLDPQSRALLERVAEFNARRAAKKPPATT